MYRKCLASILVLFTSIPIVICNRAAASQSSTGTASVGSSSSADSPTRQSAKLVDINSASKDELAALPGIGHIYAQKIIDTRPHLTKRDLVLRKIIPPSTYLKIQDQIIALQGSIRPAKSLQKK